ncbi:glutaredoxin family protein [Lysobacter sp. HDW10]|uniref:glutaredoxin family protein n=1 Tax=Lysobacter sp. HDW10 TaxID=2714936 RepID=UPI001F11721F|nr:glutaredoxin family protein [Lysobacter sp. HDW10]
MLYQRDYCHLCDLALAELAAARAPEFESIFIDDLPELEPIYGVRVPVFKDIHTGAEIGWPFDAASVRDWLSNLPGITP